MKSEVRQYDTGDKPLQYYKGCMECGRVIDGYVEAINESPEGYPYYVICDECQERLCVQ